MNTSNKIVIFTADDFGLTEQANLAVLKGISEGFLTSACICANGEFYEHAFNEILPKIPQIDLGVHLNIIDGRSLLGHTLLTNENSEFNHGFISLLLNSYRKKFLKEIELEFRAQIEKVLKDSERTGLKVNFLNSHVHTHSIPKIFELTCKLAKEYGISAVRNQAEKIYFSSQPIKPLNLVKIMLLNYFSIINRPQIKKYGLKTNDYIIGVGYTGEMDENTITDGIKALKHFNNIVAEILIHPEIDSLDIKKNKEFLTTMNKDLKEKIENSGFKFGSFAL